MRQDGAGERRRGARQARPRRRARAGRRARRPRRRRPVAAPGPAPARPGGDGDPDADGHAHAARGGKRACDDDLDNDGDGQTDWEDPGCSDAGDTTENSEVAVSAECAASSGIGMADDPTELNVGINPGCGTFWEAEVQVAPGVASCTANNDYECMVYDPFASALAARTASATPST